MTSAPPRRMGRQPGGAASRRAEQSTLENRNPGLVHFHGLNSVKKKDGSLVVMNRNGELVIWNGWRSHTWLCWLTPRGAAGAALEAVESAVLEAWGL